MDIILKSFPNLTEKQIALLQQLEPLYADWNSKINLSAIRDEEGIYVKHFLDSVMSGSQPARRSSRVRYFQEF